ncbi:MAG: hypothetical protein SWK90_06285 [Chloroflexota bacterium]|nr:hypothetical protein [Chloroflexota bacterium]
MYQYPQGPKKIRERINRYERGVRKEYEKIGFISDGYGKRYLLGLAQNRLNIWHGSNIVEKDYLEYAPPEIWELWDKPALQWAKETYDSPEFCRVRARYIEIYEQLGSEPPGPKRSQLVNKAFKIQTIGKG